MVEPPSSQNDGPYKNTTAREWAAMQCAVMFLTRIPVPGYDYREQDLARSAAYFPLVGLLIGAIGAATYYLALTVFPSTVSVALSLVMQWVATGGFHEDGLADTADGFGGGWQTDDKLRIMKDSRIGTYGALALLGAVLLKFTALSALDPAHVGWALLIGHAWGRWTVLPMIRWLPYVSLGGTGKPLVGQVTTERLLLGTALALLPALLWPGNILFSLLISAALILFVFGRFCQRQVGGITGDTLGAANQLVEVVVYLVCLATLAP